MRIIPLIILYTFFSFTLISQRGKDGAKVITSKSVVNEYTSLTSSALLGASTLTVQQASLNANSRFTGPLQTGDLLFVYNVQGATLNGSIDPFNSEKGLPQNNSWGEVTNYNNVGLYEFVEVKSVLSSTQIELMCPLKFDHTIGGNSEKVMVVRVPRYLSLTINDTLTCDPWDGAKGGVLVTEVLGITTINGVMDVSGKGFRGGDLNANSPDYEPGYSGNTNKYGGEKGESIGGFKTSYNIYGGAFGRGAPANAGGGGNSHNGGGGGGANAGVNGIAWTGLGVPNNSLAWNLENPGMNGSRSSGGGRGGYCFSTKEGDALSQGPGNPVWQGHNREAFGGLGGRPMAYTGNRIFFGGGGGSGHQNDTEGGKGGNAGGMVILHSYGTVTGSGKVLANGQNGKGSEGKVPNFGQLSNADGSGGGGAGGTIHLTVTDTISGLNFFAEGGAGGNQVLTAGLFYGPIEMAQGPGAGGGGGYVALSVVNGFPKNVKGGINGTTNSPSLAEFPANGATSGDSGILVQAPKNYHFYGTDTTLCGGASVALSPTIIGTLPTVSGQLEWFTSYEEQTPFFTGNTFTTPVLTARTVYYFGGCGAHFKDSIVVNVSNPIVVDTNAMVVQNETCLGMDGSISGITATGGIGGLSYFWNNTLASSLDTFNLFGGTFNLVVRDSLGCADSVNNLMVLPAQKPVINTNFQTIVADSCERNTGKISGLYVTNGSGSYLYSLDGNGVAGLNRSGLTQGPHLLVVEDINSGCTDSLEFQIPAIAPPDSVFGNDTTLCDGQSITLDATTTNATYVWQDGSTNANFYVDTTGIYWVDITAFGCVKRDSITITFINGGTIDLGNDTNLCNNQAIQLDATVPNGSYTWQDNSGSATFDVSSAGTYFVEVNQNGCILRDTIEITYEKYTVNLGNDTTLCDQETIVLDITTPNATYLWNDNSTDSVYTISSGGLYKATVSVKNCKVSDSITVVYFQTPMVNLGNDTTICDGESILLDVSAPDVTYAWSNGSTMPTRTVDKFGVYSVEVTNFCGTVSDTIEITEGECTCFVYVPNTFTPNGDGMNEVLQVGYGCDIDLFEFRVYSRQGILVYESYDPDEFWTGEHRGGVNEAETYAYLLRYRVAGEIEIRYRDGHVNLIR